MPAPSGNNSRPTKKADRFESAPPRRWVRYVRGTSNIRLDQYLRPLPNKRRRLFQSEKAAPMSGGLDSKPIPAIEETMGLHAVAPHSRLWRAIALNRMDEVKQAIAEGADVRRHGGQVLIDAAHKQNREIVDLLMRLGRTLMRRMHTVQRRLPRQRRRSGDPRDAGRGGYGPGVISGVTASFVHLSWRNRQLVGDRLSGGKGPCLVSPCQSRNRSQGSPFLTYMRPRCPRVFGE